MRKLLAYGFTDASSFYRAVGPLTGTEIRSAGWNVTFVRDAFDWTVLAEHDAMFIQRPHAPGHIQAFLAAKSMNIPVWVDFDDDLLDVPLSNQTHDLYMAPQTQSHVRMAIKDADAVSVSTKALAERFEALRGREVHLIPNAWSDRFYPLGRVRPNATEKTILWRGSSTHNEDIDNHLSALGAIAAKYPDWKWLLMGEPHWKLREILGPKASILPARGDVTTYFQSLQAIRPSVCLVPLAPNGFNRAKSNIAWQEATYAGAACVAPKWDEWDMDCIARYYPGKPGSLVEAFERAAKKPAQYVEKSLGRLPLLSKTNALRVDLLDGLVSRGGAARLELVGGGG